MSRLPLTRNKHLRMNRMASRMLHAILNSVNTNHELSEFTIYHDPVKGQKIVLIVEPISTPDIDIHASFLYDDGDYGEVPMSVFIK